MLTKPLTDDDRRIKTRFGAACLQVTLRQRGLLGWRNETIALHCIDVNRYGLAVQSPISLGLGHQVLLDFRGKYITQSAVNATVVSERPYRTGFRVGLHFDYCMNIRSYSRTLDNSLSRIEALYRNMSGNPARSQFSEHEDTDQA